MSDFERTFGAGANLDSIVSGFSCVPNSSGFDASEIVFYDYSDALEFIKKDSNLVLRVSSETYEECCMFVDFDQEPSKTTVTRDVYKVSCLDKGEYIRVVARIKDEYPCEVIPQVFALTVPYDPDQAVWMNYPFDSRLSDMIERKELTLESIGDYFSEMGCSQRTALIRKPRDLNEINLILKSNRRELIPISEAVSVIFSDGESVDAALVTEGNCTYLIQYGFSNKIYDMLV